MNLEAIEARAKAASKGPWWFDGKGHVTVYAATRSQNLLNKPVADVLPQGRDENAIFIAHAREDVPALVAEVKRLRILCAQYEHHMNLETKGER